jgi:hypothetical protein
VRRSQPRGGHRADILRGRVISAYKALDGSSTAARVPGTARDGYAAVSNGPAIQIGDCAGRIIGPQHGSPEMLKAALWIVVVIFIIGLLVVFGVLDFIF